MMRKLLWAIAISVAFLCVPAYADAPQSLAVQGHLTDAAGTPINDVFAVVFTLYTDENGTSSVWTEELPVNFVDGNFTAYLGSATTLDLTVFRDNGSLYLGVKVADDDEMQPFALASAPFAGFAQYAGSAGGLSSAATLQIVDNVATQLENDAKVHDRYTDAEAVAAVTAAFSTDATALAAALGAEDPTNPLNHPRFTDAEARAAALEVYREKRCEELGTGYNSTTSLCDPAPIKMSGTAYTADEALANWQLDGRGICGTGYHVCTTLDMLKYTGDLTVAERNQYFNPSNGYYHIAGSYHQAIVQGAGSHHNNPHPILWSNAGESTESAISCPDSKWVGWAVARGWASGTSHLRAHEGGVCTARTDSREWICCVNEQ